MRKIMVALLGSLLLGGLIPAAEAGAIGLNLCESSGSYCVGAPNLHNGTAVYESRSGRASAFETDGGNFCLGSKCYPTGTLNFTTGTNTCAVADPAYDGLVVVEPCSGVAGVTWAGEKINGHWHFINVYGTRHSLATLFLAGENNGFDYTIQPTGEGYYEAFDFR